MNNQKVVQEEDAMTVLTEKDKNLIERYIRAAKGFDRVSLEAFVLSSLRGNEELIKNYINEFLEKGGR
jgi:hypothetical protein